MRHEKNDGRKHALREQNQCERTARTHVSFECAHNATSVHRDNHVQRAIRKREPQIVCLRKPVRAFSNEVNRVPQDPCAE